MRATGRVVVFAVMLFATGISSSTSDSVALNVQSENVETAFAIDPNTVAGWDFIVVDNKRIQVKGVTSGTVPAPPTSRTTPFVSAFLYAEVSGYGTVAEDLLVFGRKDSFYFSAENSAKTELIQNLRFFTLTLRQQLRVYDLIPEEPQFEELVELYAQTKNIPSDESLSGRKTELQAAILLAVLEKIR